MSAAAFIVDAVRSPIGRRGGSLAHWHPADLAGHVIAGLLDRTGVDPERIDDVILGCVSAVGAQASNIARTSWLSAGFPESVPATTVDRQCGSSQQAVHAAAQAVMSGVQDLIVAGGVEVMSLVPLLSPMTAGEELGMGAPFAGEGWIERYGDQEISQFRGAEIVTERWACTREALDRFSLRSHELAANAIDSGHFNDEIVPVGDFAVDECVRRTTSYDQLSRLPALRDNGAVTAGMCSQIADGAAALLLASEQAVDALQLQPLARIRALAVAGADPIAMLTAPIPATERALKAAGVAIGDVRRFEVNEAFAPVVLAWAADTGADLDRTNVNGGSIALGHPLGATGARLMTTLVHEVHRAGGLGLQAVCEWGGTANATIIQAT